MRMRAATLLLAVGLVACGGAPLRMTSAGTVRSTVGSRRVEVTLPSYTSTVVRGRDCRQRFGYGPRYEDHPPCVAGASAPTFTLRIPDVSETAASR